MTRMRDRSMGTLKSGFAWLLLSIILLMPGAWAQEGYPLEGTWEGYWGKTPSTRQFLTLIMRWDGRKVSGLVDPGPNAGTLRSVRLDSTDWTVEIVMDVKNASGDTVRLTADGRLENIGSYERTLAGVWRHDGDSGFFKISRQ